MDKISIGDQMGHIWLQTTIIVLFLLNVNNNFEDTI